MKNPERRYGPQPERTPGTRDLTRAYDGALPIFANNRTNVVRYGKYEFPKRRIRLGLPKEEVTAQSLNTEPPVFIVEHTDLRVADEETKRNLSLGADGNVRKKVIHNRLDEAESDDEIRERIKRTMTGMQDDEELGLTIVSDAELLDELRFFRDTLGKEWPESLTIPDDQGEPGLPTDETKALFTTTAQTLSSKYITMDTQWQVQDTRYVLVSTDKPETRTEVTLMKVEPLDRNDPDKNNVTLWNFSSMDTKIVTARIEREIPDERLAYLENDLMLEKIKNDVRGIIKSIFKQRPKEDPARIEEGLAIIEAKAAEYTMQLDQEVTVFDLKADDVPDFPPEPHIGWSSDESITDKEDGPDDDLQNGGPNKGKTK